jgi:hypothetical protein
MSTKYTGGFITKNPVAPTTSAASGIWTLDQQQQAQKAGTWPSPPNFIEDVFSTYLYTGNGSTQTITNDIDLSNKGGLVWIKNRDTGGYIHNLYDTARGLSGGFGLRLQSNATSAQAVTTGTLSSFNTNGFSLGDNIFVNNNALTFASWTFREQPKFFDVVTYTGNGTSPRNISHNLGSAPGCIIMKRLDSTSNWPVYHRGLDATNPQNYAIELNSTDPRSSSSADHWGGTAPTSTVFTIGANYNTNGQTWVAYLFAHDAGGFGLTGNDNVISCGSVTYDSTNGNTINLGYEAQFVILKSATAVTQWYMQDIMRGMASGPDSGSRLFPNLDSAEDAGFIVGPTATGFNIKPGFFSNGNNVIYIAIRRGPMKTPTVGTSVFSPNYPSAGQTSPYTAVTNFPVDLNISTPTVGGYNRTVMDRLRGGPSTTQNNYLITQTTAAEQATGSGTYLNFQNNTAIIDNGWWAGYSLMPMYWNFRRAPSFFDEVCYTGTGSLSGVTHNLTITPELKIIKRRASAASDWIVAGSIIGENGYIYLNSTAGITSFSNYWDGGDDSPTLFSVRNGNGASDASGSTYVAYLFATCAGVSKVGSYTGTGALQTVNCGFTSGARFVLIKRTDSTGDWYVWDTARGMVSGTDPSLLLNSTAAEVNANSVYTASTGFEIVSTAAGINASGGTYIFLAIA